MAYRISARHPGRSVTYKADTEEEALAKCDELNADGVPFDLTDADGNALDEADLEDRIDAKDSPEA
jgi:hypothetical protein